MDSLVFNLDFIMVFFFLLSLVFLLFVTLALLIGGVLGVQVDLNLAEQVRGKLASLGCKFLVALDTHAQWSPRSTRTRASTDIGPR